MQQDKENNARIEICKINHMHVDHVKTQNSITYSLWLHILGPIYSSINCILHRKSPAIHFFVNTVSPLSCSICFSTLKIEENFILTCGQWSIHDAAKPRQCLTKHTKIQSSHHMKVLTYGSGHLNQKCFNVFVISQQKASLGNTQDIQHMECHLREYRKAAHLIFCNSMPIYLA